MKLIFAEKEKQYRTARAGLRDVDKADALTAANPPALQALIETYKDAWNAMVSEEKNGSFTGALTQVPKVQAAIDQLVTTAEEYEKYRTAKAGLTDVVKADALEAADAPALEALIKTYHDEWNAMVDAATVGDFTTALDQVPKVQDAINQLITTAEENDRKATAAVKTVTELSARNLKAKSTAEKIRLLNEVCSGSGAELTDEQKAARRALYKAMEMDPEFLEQDAKARKKIANEMTDTKEKRTKLKKLKKTWKKDPPKGPTKDEKLDLMREALAVQCRALGIDPPPEVVEVDEPPTIVHNDDGSISELIEDGYFNLDDGKIYINTNAKSSFHKSMARALDLALHENSHNYQHELVKQLEDGTLKPGDPEYQQALMFQANDGPRGYVDSKEGDFDTYQKQPQEEHAFSNGPKTSKAILKKL
jgi:hypothetical protein